MRRTALLVLVAALDLHTPPGAWAAVLAAGAAPALVGEAVHAVKKAATPVPAKDEEAIRSLESEWEQAILRRDLPALRRLMHPDFVLVGVTPSGPSTVPLDVWLDNLVNKMKVESYSAQVTRVRVYGDAAVASLDGSWKVDFSGRPVDDHFFLTDAWVRQDGIWRAVLRHSSRYQPASSAPSKAPQ